MSAHAVLWGGTEFHVQPLKEAAARGLALYLAHIEGAPQALLLIGVFAEHLSALGFVTFLKENKMPVSDLPFFDDEEAALGDR